MRLYGGCQQILGSKLNIMFGSCKQDDILSL